jgi:hypothetical protein
MLIRGIRDSDSVWKTKEEERNRQKAKGIVSGLREAKSRSGSRKGNSVVIGLGC